MRLLVITQTVDVADSQLGFFTSWIDKLSQEVDKTEVICLKKGDYHAPENSVIYSLGKELGRRSRFVYTYRFFKILFKIRGKYTHVFVHMNQDYVLLAGLMWWFQGVPVGLWRNHYSGSFLTRLAVGLSSVSFATSRDSYTARFPKTVFMPVGVDIARFPKKISPKQKRIICIGRLSSSKHTSELVQAFKLFHEKNPDFVLDIVGSIDPGQESYIEEVKKYVAEHSIEESIIFHGPVSHKSLVDLLHKASVAVNLGAPGMFDKTILEAMASGTVVVANNLDITPHIHQRCQLKEVNGKALAAVLEDVALDTSFLASEGERQSKIAQDRYSLSKTVQDIVVFLKKAS